MLKGARLLTLLAFLSMFFLGVGVTLIGAAARNIGLSPPQIGMLIAVQNLGFMVALIISGALADTCDKTRILFFGSLLLAVSFFTFYQKDVFALNLFIMFLMGLGIGTYEGVTDPLLLKIHSQKEAFFISINHFFVTFGCLIITIYLLFLQMDWRRAMDQAALAVFILALFFAVTRLKGNGETVEALSSRFRFLRQQKVILIFFLATVCASGLEMCLIGFMTTFLMELRDHSQVTSKIGLILFLSGIGLGRLLVGFLTKRLPILDLISFLFALSAAFLVVLLLVQTTALTYVFIFLSGAAISALFPLLIAYAGIHYKDIPGTVLGVIKLALPLGGILLPLAFSLISEYATLRISVLMLPAIALTGFMTVFLSRRRLQEVNINMGPASKIDI